MNAFGDDRAPEKRRVNSSIHGLDHCIGAYDTVRRDTVLLRERGLTITVREWVPIGVAVGADLRSGEAARLLSAVDR